MSHPPISFFTACTPWLPLAELAPLAIAAGATGLDLACKPHRYDPTRAASFWDNNAAVLDVDRLDVLAPAAAAILAQAKLACPVLAGYSPCTDIAAARVLTKAAQTLSAPCVRLWIPAPEPGRAQQQLATLRTAWRELAAIGAGEGVQFVFETHDHSMATGASAAARIIEGLDPRHVGVILDVANTLREGTEPLAMAVDVLGPHLCHVHVKDVALRQGGSAWCGYTSEFTALGQGWLRWPVILATLRRGGYRGWLAIENFTGCERGPPRLAEDVAWLRAQLAAINPEL